MLCLATGPLHMLLPLPLPSLHHSIYYPSGTHPGEMLPPVDVGQYLETSGAVTAGGGDATGV